MTDQAPQNSPFGPFQPGPAPVSDPPTGKKRGPKKGAKRGAGKSERPPFRAPVQGETAPVKVPTRKRKTTPSGIKLDLTAALQIGSSLKAEDVRHLEHLVAMLYELPKASRARLVAALGKVFA